MILGSDGVDMLEKRVRQQLNDDPSKKTATVAVNTLFALISYYQRLVALCPHEYHVSSPIDSAAVCGKCGHFADGSVMDGGR